MKTVCPNCGYKIDLKDVPHFYLDECPKCGAPILNKKGIGLMWM